MNRRTVLLLAVAVVAVAVPADAEERDTATGAVLDRLPAPSAEQAWEFRGYVLRDGRPYGKVTLSGGPHPEQAGHWAVRDEITPRHAKDFAVLKTAVLDRRLRAVEGCFHRRNTRGFLRARFKREGGLYRIEYESDYYENRLDVKGAGGLATLAGVVTFLRHAPAGKAVYVLRDFDPDPSGGDKYALKALVHVHGEARWKLRGGVRDAWIASYTRGRQTLRLAFDLKSRELLGVEYVGLAVQLVPEGSGPVGLVATGTSLATPLERAVERTAEIRRDFDAPRKALSFLGDVLLGDTPVGTVMLSAEPTSVDGAPAWRVLESQTIRVGAAVIEHEISGFLAQDLTVLRGERIDKRPEGTFHVTYRRVKGGIETVAHTEDGPQPPVVLGAPEGAMTGLVPALLFLRSVPREIGHFVLPGWDPRYAQKPKAGTGTFTLSRSDLHIEVLRGTRGRFRRAPFVARCARRDGRSFEVAMSGSARRLVGGVDGLMPNLDLEPASASASSRPDWYDAVEGKPQTWRQAFVKFGRGYHLPRRDLLEDAFHWPSMVKHAISEKRYPQGTSEAKIRKDWIDVFVGMSKHRTKADCDDLLFQIFMTSQETEHADGSVSLRTLPAYGGHTYRMQELDGRWWIVKID